MDREERSDVDICRKTRVSKNIVTTYFAQGTYHVAVCAVLKGRSEGSKMPHPAGRSSRRCERRFPFHGGGKPCFSHQKSSHSSPEWRCPCAEAHRWAELEVWRKTKSSGAGALGGWHQGDRLRAQFGRNELCQTKASKQPDLMMSTT